MSEEAVVKEVVTEEVITDEIETPPVEKPVEEEPVEEPVKKETTEEIKSESEPTDDPENPDVRVVPEVADYVLPEGMPTELAQFAKDNDYTQEQLDKTLQQFGSYVQGTRQAEQEVLRESGEAHLETWGEHKDYNLALVRKALKQNDPKGTLTAMLNETGYGNHPAVLDFFLSIGSSMKEGGFLKGAVNRPQGKSTAASAMFGKAHPSAN